MAIPDTGAAVTMTQINNYFVGEGQTSTFVLGTLGTYLGIASGTTINMSSTFGGQGT
jgi:heme O synthase-like polyprenyltransferase